MMKKPLLLSFGIVGALLCATAQTIDFNDIPLVIGSTYVQANSNYLDPGSAGQNQTWDLSALVSTGEFTTNIVDPSGQPGSENFPLANFASTIVEAPGQVGYSRAANNKVEIVGLYTPAGISTWPDPRSQFEFPLSYQATFTDTYERVSDLGEGVLNQEIGTISAVVDGSGTLITPTGTYTDVLRIRFETEADLIASINGQVFSTTPLTEVTHVFMKAGFIAPLLSLVNYEISEQTTTLGVYYIGGTVGIVDQPVVSDLSLYPVPVIDQLAVRFNLEASAHIQFNLLAMDGRLIGQLSEQTLFQGANTVELEMPADLATGMYLVQLMTDKGSQTRRIVVQ